MQNAPRRRETGGNQFSLSKGNNPFLSSEKKLVGMNQEQSQELEKATSAGKRDTGAATKIKQL